MDMIIKEDNMQAIFSCKMYKASTRKDKIRAAINNPINKELVQQLSEYLDEEYRNPKEVEQPSSDKSDVANSPKDVPSEKTAIRPSEHSGGAGSTPPPSHHVADHHLSNMLKEEEESGAPAPSEGAPAPEKQEEESKADTVGESTSVSGSPVTANFECPVHTDCPTVSIAKSVDSIMGLLNTVQDTAGVRLVSVKDPNELWIYYKDAINLNNVMEPAIAALNSADYNHLNFNRLARTDNAIVFEITLSPKPVEPIVEVEDEKK